MTPLSAARKVLLPLASVYRMALWARERRLGTSYEPIRQLRFPVVSIGNLSTGGTGKTPLAIALAQALTRRGIRVDVLSRGYGRQSQGPARVLPDGTAEAFGDEPLLISRVAGVPVYVSRHRLQAGLLAEDDLVEAATLADTTPFVLHLLDDGFQHRRLARAVDVLLLNREDWTDRLLPAGNLREPIEAIRRASILAIPADDLSFESDLRTWGWQGPLWRTRRTMQVPNLDGTVLAFCAIARPVQFFAGLEAAGLKLAARISFSDHHRFTQRDIDRLLAKAAAVQASALITTEKDLVRLHSSAFKVTAGLPLQTAALRIDLEDEASALDLLLSRLNLFRTDSAL
jgi:tetraacyldisaccharide 4'-kinase